MFVFFISSKKCVLQAIYVRDVSSRVPNQNRSKPTFYGSSCQHRVSMRVLFAAVFLTSWICRSLAWSSSLIVGSLFHNKTNPLWILVGDFCFLLFSEQSHARNKISLEVNITSLRQSYRQAFFNVLVSLAYEKFLLAGQFYVTYGTNKSMPMIHLLCWCQTSLQLLCMWHNQYMIECFF